MVATDKSSAPTTLASCAYQKLRRDIIRAEFLPGQKLLIGQLSSRYSMGASPIREALNRLSRDGLVIHSEQRGFSLTPLSEVHLEELNRTRGWLNEIGLRESIAHGDSHWEEGVLLAFHRLRKEPKYVTVDEKEVVSERWEQAHREFHRSLVAACRSPWLVRYCDQLFDEAERYRFLSRLPRQDGGVDGRDEHEPIMEAIVARDAGHAVRLLHEHFERTAQLVRLLLKQGPRREGTSKPVVPTPRSARSSRRTRLLVS